MLPDGVLSSINVFGYYLSPDDRDPSLTEDFEWGGIGLNDPSQGLYVQIWKLRLDIDDTDFGTVLISAPNYPEAVLFSGQGITEISLTFDQNMNPFVAFMQAGEAKFRWFDTVVSGIVTTTLPTGSHSPKTCLDDKRSLETVAGTSDIILGYMRAGSLYYRQQRDRYTIEYLLKSGLVGSLLLIGMTRANRLQFAIGEFE